MSLYRTGRTPRAFALGVVSASLLLTTAVGVNAQEGGFFEMLFGGQRQAAPAPAVAPSHDYADRSVYRRQRTERRRALRVKTRYAALPRAESITEEISGKQPVDQKAIQDNPTKAILEDKTLRPGDIVVMPAGPKVFVGNSQKNHRMSEFEDVKHSRFVDKKTRFQLLAMMVPIGAMPADQARKVMKVKLKLAHTDEIKAVEAKNETTDQQMRTMRKIMPWKGAAE
ncbi:hypothetical protein [Methylobacterium gnaphalii]|uniref:Uncharacterized protein n=1 Tax=Methylobacterium gnaphalii TaxID=1010610 RepID=A0A512JN47_9HYPH|nr:hypothetical protein [Methylobacterium gnaphalii]GEP11379.1 hypothetical protein MGN01_32240 [Methylobacterium gnaphalii]GJD71393.1 hypothetical protein MMMDOFMJ_4349 [Methylobacterium gnaphalii]GLS47973.1 hypothetical protein GCM10007885_08170 [Methylobacterium gnaphalii]